MALVFLPVLLFAHAILEQSSPQAGSTIAGPDLRIKLHFNARIDGKRSQIEVISAHATLPLPLDSQTSPEILSGYVKLPAGDYKLRWQVLAIDGHITRGEIPFTMK